MLLGDPNFEILDILCSSSLSPDHIALIGELICQIAYYHGKEAELLGYDPLFSPARRTML